MLQLQHELRERQNLFSLIFWLSTYFELQLRKEFPDRKLRGKTVKTYPETCFKWVYMMLERRNRMPQMKERLILFDFTLCQSLEFAERS